MMPLAGVRTSPLLARFLRFAVIGAASGILYAGLVVAGVQLLSLDATIASLIAYGLTIPPNFIGQRSLAFRSNGAVTFDLARYGVTQLANTLFAATLMTLCVTYAGLPYGYGIAAGIGLGPFLTFIMLDRWAFARRHR